MFNRELYRQDWLMENSRIEHNSKETHRDRKSSLRRNGVPQRLLERKTRFSVKSSKYRNIESYIEIALFIVERRFLYILHLNIIYVLDAVKF